MEPLRGGRLVNLLPQKAKDIINQNSMKRTANMMYAENMKNGRREYLMCTALRKNPSSASQCVECGKCEQHCPQHIEIRKELKNARRELETPIYKVAKIAVKLFRIY